MHIHIFRATDYLDLMAKIILYALLLIFPVAALAQNQSVPQSRPQVTLSFAPLVKQVAPAVVNIYARRVVEQRVISPLFDDPFFRHFFQDSMPQGLSRQRLENSLGSGVIIRADGLIVTSNHVIHGADEIRVALSDRREFDATIVTTDEHADLAVLRIDTKGQSLPFLQLKDSDEAEVGDLVLAIGNPFGVGQTVTSGIISAMTHTSVGSSDLDYFIQTDAAINPGNSGGALVTMDGKLVGINSAIYSRDGGNLGIGFAVPSNLVRVILNAVAMGQKTIIHPWLGINGQELTPALAASLNMAQPSGFLVGTINPASPVLKAGLKSGDVITSVNGRSIDDMESFRYRVSTLPIGSMASLGVIRKGEKLSIPVVLITPPENPPRDLTIVTGRNPFAGATLQNLSPAVIEETGVHDADHGVIITDVKADTPATSVNLRTGDIILSVNNIKTATVKDVMNAITQPSSGWRISIQRGSETITVMVGG